MRKINVAVDGPAGAGKSTIARECAKRLSFIYADTGALYRAVALHALQSGADCKQSAQVIPLLDGLEISLKFVDGEQRVFLCGEDVSENIRTPEVSMGASEVSAIPEVRNFLFDMQKQLAREYSVIMDGRDIGTVVLPDADLKIFLTASPEERARRRYADLAEKPGHPSYDEVLADIIARDYNDSHRAVSPLKQAEDAVLLDTSDMTLEQSVQCVIEMIEKL